MPENTLEIGELRRGRLTRTTAASSLGDPNWVAEEILDLAFVADDESVTCRAHQLGEPEQNIRRWRKRENQMPASTMLRMGRKWDRIGELLAAYLTRRPPEESQMKASYVVTTVYNDGRPSRTETRKTKDDANRLAKLETAAGRRADPGITEVTIDRIERLWSMKPERDGE